LDATVLSGLAPGPLTPPQTGDVQPMDEGARRRCAGLVQAEWAAVVKRDEERGERRIIMEKVTFPWFARLQMQWFELKGPWAPR